MTKKTTGWIALALGVATICGQAMPSYACKGHGDKPATPPTAPPPDPEPEPEPAPEPATPSA